MGKLAYLAVGVVIGVLLTTSYWKNQSTHLLKSPTEVDKLLELPELEFLANESRIRDIPNDSGKALLALLACVGKKVQIQEEIAACKNMAIATSAPKLRVEKDAHTTKQQEQTLSETSKQSKAPGTTPKTQSLPKSWSKTETDASDYSAGLDTKTRFQGSPSLFLGSIGEPQAFGAFARTIDASPYLSRKVRFSAYVKTQDVEGWVGLWMRVDSTSDQVLSFDNMQKRPIVGTSDWKKYDITLDVPENAAKIVLGMLVHGKGQAWCSKAQFSGMPLAAGEYPIRIDQE